LLQKYLKTKFGAAAATKVAEINARMRLVPRCEDGNLPFCNDKYIPDHSRVQAKEHRNVMQILPFILNGSADDDLTKLAAL